MEIKYLGLTTILGISLYIAVRIRKYAADRIRFFTSIYGFIAYIRNQIEYFCTPTEEFIDSFSDDFLEGCGFLSSIEGNSWDEAIRKCRYIDRSNAAVLLDFSSRLGKTGSDEQLANCEYTMEEIKKTIEVCRCDADTRYKAYSALTVIIGFMLVIALI